MPLGRQLESRLEADELHVMLAMRSGIGNPKNPVFSCRGNVQSRCFPLFCPDPTSISLRCVKYALRI